MFLKFARENIRLISLLLQVDNTFSCLCWFTVELLINVSFNPENCRLKICFSGFKGFNVNKKT